MNLSDDKLQKIEDGHWYVAGFDIWETPAGYKAVRMPTRNETFETLEQAETFARQFAFSA